MVSLHYIKTNDFAHFFSNTKEEPILFPIKKNKNPAAFEARDLAQKKRIARMKKKIKDEQFELGRFMNPNNTAKPKQQSKKKSKQQKTKD